MAKSVMNHGDSRRVVCLVALPGRCESDRKRQSAPLSSANPDNPNTLRHNDSKIAWWWTPDGCGLNVINKSGDGPAAQIRRAWLGEIFPQEGKT